MKEGDIITWRGVNKMQSGVVAKDEKGEFFCLMPNGCSFRLADLRYSKTAKLIEK